MVIEELKNDKGNITKASLKDRIKEIKDDINAEDEVKILNEYMSLTDEESKAAKKIKDEVKKLDKKVEGHLKKMGFELIIR